MSYVPFSPLVSRLSVAFVGFPVARFFLSLLLVVILCSCGGVRLPGEVGESGPYGGASSPWWSIFYLLFWLLGIALHPVDHLKYKKSTVAQTARHTGKRIQIKTSVWFFNKVDN